MASDRRRRRAWLLALLTGLSALLAVATNLATSAVPQRFTGVTTNPLWTWGATAVLVLVVGVEVQRLSASEPSRPRAFIGTQLKPGHLGHEDAEV